MGFSIAVQEADFDVGTEYQALIVGDTRAGAHVLFVGRVRDMNMECPVQGLFLEHYPGMTEQVLQSLVDDARKRWELLGVRLIHRVGHLRPGDQIVLVATSSAHRAHAFEAAEFLMDLLKTKAPFWKKEHSSGGAVWLESRAQDNEAGKRWL